MDGADVPSKVDSAILDRVVIRFAGDSGDGMQLAGDRFTHESAVFGNDLATFPNYPAEIRAPAGTLAGVSSFQVQFSDHDIMTPGDTPNVLVAMNPAALKANVTDLEPGATIIVNIDSFDQRNLTKAGYESNPLEDGSLDSYPVFEVPMTSLTLEAAKETGAKAREAERSKNFFALGLVSWMYTRPIESTVEWNDKKFAKSPVVRDANLAALKAGWNFGETAELFGSQYEVRPAQLPAGEYRSISGNVALAYGIITAGVKTKLPIFFASYPITPASDVLHELSRHKEFGVRTMQAEDEIAAVGAALGAAFGGQLGITATSGPGLDLKSETLGLAMQLELPLLVIDIQRGGPSTGLPTKTEQADLLLAMYGRHGEAPVPIVAASTPGDCFWAAIEAIRIAVQHMTPVILLSDGYLANGSEPWPLPNVDSLDNMAVHFQTEPNHEGEYWPYLRDSHLVRPWAIPGTPGLEHRIGGLEKQDGTGNISYEPLNHERMVQVRAEKVALIAEDIDLLSVDDPDGAELLVLGWGSTYGAIGAATRQVRALGYSVARAHLRHMNPLPRNTGEVLRKYKHVLVPELNMGQLTTILRSKFLVDVQSFCKVQGLPFRTAEITAKILEFGHDGAADGARLTEVVAK